MALSTLNWKKLPTVTTATNLANTASVTIVLNAIANMLTGSTYFDGSSRTPGSGSAWKYNGKYTIGNNTETIYCTPPTLTALSQSLILAGRNTTGQVSTGTPTLMSSDQSFSTNKIYAGISKLSRIGSIPTGAAWTGSKPMGAQSSFNGFGSLSETGLTSLNRVKINIYESQEAICMILGENATPTINGAFIAGAYLDPQTSTVQTGSADYENDGRIYGMTKTRYVGDGNNPPVFVAGAFSFLSNNGGSYYTLHTVLTPNVIGSVVAADLELLSTSPGTSYGTRSNKFVKHSLLSTTTARTVFLGTYRQIVTSKNFQNGLVLRDGSNNLVGYTLSGRDDQVNQAIIFLA
jgi:hypothetical protein